MKIKKSDLKKIICEELDKLTPFEQQILDVIADKTPPQEKVNILKQVDPDEVNDLIDKANDARESSPLMANVPVFAFDLKSLPGYQLVIQPPKSGQIDKTKHVKVQKKSAKKVDQQPTESEFGTKERQEYSIKNLEAEVVASTDKEFMSYLEDFIPGFTDFMIGLRGSGTSAPELIAYLLSWAFDTEGRSSSGSGVGVSTTKSETLPSDLLRNMINSGEPLPPVQQTNMPPAKVADFIIKYLVNRTGIDVSHPAFKRFVRGRLKRSTFRNAMLRILKNYKYISGGQADQKGSERSQELMRRLDPNPKNDESDIVTIGGKPTRIIYR